MKTYKKRSMCNDHVPYDCMYLKIKDLRNVKCNFGVYISYSEHTELNKTEIHR